MPVKVCEKLPAAAELERENIFVMSESRAVSQDIRPLRIAILNLMPNKSATEKQLLRLIANTPLQIEVVFLYTSSYESKNTDSDYLKSFYKTIDEVIEKKEAFDGLIITGAPVEQLDFTEVLYWKELEKVFLWAKKSVHSSMYICWAAQAALFYHYGIGKKTLDKKISGIFSHTVLDKNSPLLRGFDEHFFAPHSRYTEVDTDTIRKEKSLKILVTSKEVGTHIVASENLRQVFIFGHGEYDKETLHNEYLRDKEKGIKIQLPENYYKDKKVGEMLPLSWRLASSLLFQNWINYCVYQSTPYDLFRD